MLFRSGHHDGWEWSELAKLFVDRYPREIYRAIVQEQARHDDGHWFLEHELASEIASLCVEKDPVGAWEETRVHLEATERRAFRFVVGFPDGFVDRMGHSAVIEWVAVDPVTRASVMADLVAKSYDDDTLAGKLIEQYGADDDVASAFHSKLVSGPWVGSSADHWASIATGMRVVAQRARGSGLRRWATRGAEILEQMSARDRVREEEERLRGR